MKGKSRGWLVVPAVWVLAGLAAGGQSASFDRSVIVLDPAHGGADDGARIGDRIAEKEVTAALAVRLRTLLLARGFHVVMTREDDADGGSFDQRAEVANRSRAVACLVLHASNRTNGILLGTSPRVTVLAASNRPASSNANTVLWGRAQETYIAQSGLLANQVGTALVRSGISATIMRVTMRPLDNLTCPAISVEIGNRVAEGAVSLVTDGGYQQRVAESIAATLQIWRNQAQPAEYVRTDGVPE